MEVLGKVVKLFERRKSGATDSCILALLCHWSAALCIFFAALCGANQLLGSPIKCSFPVGKVQDSFAEHHCWIHGSTHIRPDFQDVTDCRTENETEGSADYQWAVILLTIQSAGFLIMGQIWKLAERDIVKEFDTLEANSAKVIFDNDKCTQVLNRFIGYFTTIIGHNKGFFVRVMLCELLTVGIIAFNFSVAFLSFGWGDYGWKALEYLLGSRTTLNPG